MKEENELHSLAPIGYPGYKISKRGDVWSDFSNRYLNPWDTPKGYMVIKLKDGDKNPNVLLHRLVGLTFISNPEGKPAINHKDCNKKNNHYTNLEWVTHKENAVHALVNGCNSHILSSEEVISICEYCKSKKDISITEIAKELDINRTTLTSIIKDKCHSHITSKYDFDFAKEGIGHKALSDDDVRRVCEMIADGFKNCDISNEVGVSAGTINHVRNKRSYTHISKEYDLDMFRDKPRRYLSETEVKQICARLCIGLRGVDIVKELGVSKHVVSLIRNRKTYFNISKDYYWL